MIFKKRETVTPVVSEPGLLGAIAAEVQAEADERLRRIQLCFKQQFGVNMAGLEELPFEQGVFNSGNVYWRDGEDEYYYENFQWSPNGVNGWRRVENTLGELHDFLKEQLDG